MRPSPCFESFRPPTPRRRLGLSSLVEGHDPQAPLERVFREEAGRLTSSLVRLLGDFDLAEELVAEALLEAVEHWPREGVPDRPGAWLLTTARRKGLDRARREVRYREKLQLIAALAEPPQRSSDDRLSLIFTCCHPALDRDAQVALTLRAVAALTTAEIARAFLVPEPTLAKRIVRAKAKIVRAGIPYRVPPPAEYRSRLEGVMEVIYLIFNEGHLATGGGAALRLELAIDAQWLAELLVRLLPDEPEPLGLLALIRLHLARWPARLDREGKLVLLDRQDRSLWDVRSIRAAARLIERASRLGAAGPYLVQAAIAAVHCEARCWGDTDWAQVLALYDTLIAIQDSAVARLNRAIAVWHVRGAQAALTEVSMLAPKLGRYHLFHATRARLLRDLGRGADAEAADRRALELSTNPAERALIAGRLTEPTG